MIVTANVSPGANQRVDVEVRDREGGAGNVYLNKKDIKGETRLAVTAHAEGDVGVCFKNSLDACTSVCLFGLVNNSGTILNILVAMKQAHTQYVRIIDLDVDIGADAVDYKYVAYQCFVHWSPTHVVSVLL